MIDAHWQRAALLYEQQRFELAEKELRALLAQDPDFAPAHALLAQVLAQTGDLDEALAAGKQAVTIDPELDFGFRAIAVVQMTRRDYKAAEEAIRIAIDLAPEDAEHRGTLAQILLLQSRWQAAITAADAGLAIDPQNTDCLNMRSVALTKLGRSDEAQADVKASLAHDPDNPYTHQARGFACLRQGQPKEALQHFQEALRRDPMLDGARAGLVEALRSHSPIYRAVLAPFVWLERFPPQRQTQVLIGAFVVAQIGRRSLAAAGYETAATVAAYSWLGVVLLTACVVPIFNLLLLLHPIGRHALDAFSKRHALMLGAALAVCIAMWIGYAFEVPWMHVSALPWTVFLLPVAGLGAFFSGWGRWVQSATCVGVIAAWVIWAWLFQAYSAEPPIDEFSDEQLEFLKGYRGNLLLAAVLSTWFTLLAPKGHPPRVRRGR
ncbi:MAG: tetratricopeptide repeat protein [Planctomycetota bacterium]